MSKRILRTTFILLLLVFVSVNVMAADMEVTILHTNDTHGRIEEGKYAGMGFAKLASIIDEYRHKKDNVLLLDAGDTFHGQTIVNLVRGENVVNIMNQMGYDAMTVGNHDFNYGQERLKELNEISQFPLLGANLDPKLVDNYLIRDIKGFKVGIFGLTTPETAYKTHPKNVEGLTFVDPVVTARDMVKTLKDKNADMVIALSHLGISEESKHSSKKVAESVDGIDLIVDGHSHNVIEKGMLVNSTLIVQAGEYDKNLGIVEITIENDQLENMRAELYTKEKAADITPDQKILELIAGAKEKNEKITSEVIGKSEVELNGERASVRTRETNLGNLVTDAMMAAVDADVAITNGGGIRASIDKGEITKGEVITVLPFGNTTIVKNIKGSELFEAVEHGISKYPAHEGLFPQVSGMSFIFAKDRPAGERVLEIWINDKPLDHDKIYKVATNDFMAAGGDGYTMFIDAKIYQEAGGLEEVVMQYINNRNSVSPEIEGRIIPVEVKGDDYYYKVKQGDTLKEIANMFKVDLSTLVEINEIENANMIYSDQELVIPVE